MEVVGSGTNKEILLNTRNNSSQRLMLIQEVEMTGEKETAFVDGVQSEDKLQIILPFKYQTERFYYLKVYIGVGEVQGDEISRSKIYCTDQTDPEKYSVLAGHYQTIDKAQQKFIVKGDPN